MASRRALKLGRGRSLDSRGCDCRGRDGVRRAGAGAALAARSSASDVSPAMAVTPNWAGYVVTGSATSPVTYSSVTGTWIVPNATCNTPATAGGFSTVWVGLGGYTTKNQEEVGTDSNCNTKNKPTYYAWFELVPYIAYNVPTNDKVLVGDTMSGTVNIRHHAGAAPDPGPDEELGLHAEDHLQLAGHLDRRMDLRGPGILPPLRLQ